MNGYNENCKDAEDLDLWLRLGNKAVLANINEPLYVYDLSKQNSFFHSNFSRGERNIRVLKLNCKAIKVFHLPKHYYIYPLARLVYPFLPTKIKTLIRSKMSQISETMISE